MNPMIIDIKSQHEIDDSCGTKATTLVELKKLGLPIPEFYAVPSSCFEYFCKVVGIECLELFYGRLQFDPQASEKFIHADMLNIDNFTTKIEDGKYMVRSSTVPTKNIDLKYFSSMISGAFESHYASSIIGLNESILNVWKSVFLEKAYNQCRIFSETSIIEGIGVLIQRYIEPVISGVAHVKEDIVSVYWTDGHLSKIVNGESFGNLIDIYLSSEKKYIIRGIESNILLIKKNLYENVFKSIWDNVTTIRKRFDCDQEVEWIYDGKEFWIVQAQPLIEQK